jgi:Na+/melibiose symporter-like transporter
LIRFLDRLRWSAAPPDASPTQRRNFVNVQIDGIGIGLASASAPFLPVFLARLGASNFQVGLLTAMPAITGLLLAVAVGRFLQRQRQIVPWFSRARFMSVMAYALTGIVTFIVPREHAVTAVLLIWALATLPQIVVNVAFSVVMNAVAGPKGRYELMSRRWSVLGLTSAITVAVAGQILERLAFPVNFQIVFVALSVGGLLSLYFSSRLELPDTEPPAEHAASPVSRLRDFLSLLRSQPAFTGFVARRFVFLSGMTLAAPIFPLYYVRVAEATDAHIGLISTAQTVTMLIGYRLWTRLSLSRGSRIVLLSTTLGMALYPALVSGTTSIQAIVLLAAVAGVFQAGLDLVFFDELMKTVPPAQTALFVSVAQSLQHMSAIAAPLIGSVLAGWIGLGGALLLSSGLRLVACVLFMRARPVTQATQAQA